MRRISVLTSGGDAAGMNAAIRAVVRASLNNGWEVFGVRRGFAGLIAGDFMPLGARDVGGIIQLGGTMLGSGRCQEFKTDDARAHALRHLRQKEIDALIVIGGDGSQHGSPRNCSARQRRLYVERRLVRYLSHTHESANGSDFQPVRLTFIAFWWLTIFRLTQRSH